MRDRKVGVRFELIGGCAVFEGNLQVARTVNLG